MWEIVGYVLKFKPMIFCCKAQAHAIEFSLAGVGIFDSKQNPQSSHISLWNSQHLPMFCRKYIATCDINGKEISFIFAFPFFTLIIFSYFLFLEP